MRYAAVVFILCCLSPLPSQANTFPITDGFFSVTSVLGGEVNFSLKGGPVTITGGDLGVLLVGPLGMDGILPGSSGTFTANLIGSSPCCTVGSFNVAGAVIENTFMHEQSFFGSASGSFVVPNVNAPILTFAAPGAILNAHGSGFDSLSMTTLAHSLVGAGTAMITMTRMNIPGQEVSYHLSRIDIVPVPEPTSWLLLVSGVAGLVVYRFLPPFGHKSGWSD